MTSRTRALSRTLAALSVVALVAVGVILAAMWWPSAAGPATPTSASLTGERSDGRGADDGVIPEGEALEVTSGAAALAGLDTKLRAALQSAAEVAHADGVKLTVTSGWRSAAYQQRLFDDAVITYGSREEAAKWVAEPHRSAHVQGLAVDVGPTDAYSWLDQHGAQWGLCRAFANEGWHYELRDIDDNGWCPQPLDSAADDERSW